MSVDYYGSSIASPQCLDTYVTTAQKMDQDEEKSDFEFLSFLVLYYIVVYQYSLCENFMAISEVLCEIWQFYILASL